MNITQIEKFLDKNYEFKYNIVKQRVYYREKKSDEEFSLLKEKNVNSICRKLYKKGIKSNKRIVIDLLNSDYVKSVNPIVEYFKCLPKWDGDDHILELSKSITTTNDCFFRWAFKKWLVALVACGIEDSIINQAVIIFIGKQGIGKSTWIESVLLPKELQEYIYSKKINPRDKDHILQLAESILINMEEVALFNSSENEVFKELITKVNIKERRAYGIFTEEYPRRASFIGSSNNKELLNDVTGNRRFLVVEATEFKKDLKIDIDQVYAQGLNLFKNNYKYWFDLEDILRVNENNSEFTKVSEVEECIKKYFIVPNDLSKGISFYNATDIASYLYKKNESSGMKRLNNIEIGKVMNALGFKTKKVKGIKKYIVELK